MEIKCPNCNMEDFKMKLIPMGNKDYGKEYTCNVCGYVTHLALTTQERQEFNA